MNRSDVWDAAYEDGFERGVEVGRADAVPPDVEPLPWCELHDIPWLSDRAGHSLRRIPQRGAAVKDCVLEDPVAHWVTAKETTT